MGFRLAWPQGTDYRDRSLDLARRICAEDHRGQEAVCPLHGCSVISRFVNGVWQWVHKGRRQDRPDQGGAP